MYLSTRIFNRQLLQDFSHRGNRSRHGEHFESLHVFETFPLNNSVNSGGQPCQKNRIFSKESVKDVHFPLSIRWQKPGLLNKAANRWLVMRRTGRYSRRVGVISGVFSIILYGKLRTRPCICCFWELLKLVLKVVLDQELVYSYFSLVRKMESEL